MSSTGTANNEDWIEKEGLIMMSDDVVEKVAKIWQNEKLTQSRNAEIRRLTYVRKELVVRADEKNYETATKDLLNLVQ
jgi:hypothetical protein